MKGKFEDDKKVGKYGEMIVKEWLEDRWHEVRDVSEDEMYQKKDIDFIVDERRTVEVKTDTQIYKFGNIYAEARSRTGLGHEHEGWFNSTEAEYIFYLDWEQLTLHIFKHEELRKTILKNNISAKSNVSNYNNKITWAYRVPVIWIRGREVFDLSDYKYLKDEYEAHVS